MRQTRNMNRKQLYQISVKIEKNIKIQFNSEKIKQIRFIEEIQKYQV
jgi:acyl carrier protein